MATLAFLLAASAAAAPVPNAAPAMASVAAPTAAPKLPGFAAALSERPMIAGPDAWRVVPQSRSLAALAQARPDTRQATRWDYARSLLGRRRGDDALGVLTVMVQDDPDLAIVPAWQLAQGAALAQSGRAAAALTALGGATLAANAEACLWRVLAAADSDQAADALRPLACAMPALRARPARDRSLFILAASRAAIITGKPALASKWLSGVPADDPAANLLRAHAQLALGNLPAGRVLLGRVAKRGSSEQRMDAKLTAIETASRAGTVSAPEALRQLDAIRFAWRGGDVEERALRLIWQLGTRTHDTRAALAAGATLFRHFDLGPETAPMVAAIQAQLAAALAPGSPRPLDQAAGLYWDYRDLAPAGADGDRLVGQLADRLQAAGLYARAAELLGYQLTARAKDIAQGPLSAKVASLHILAGHPARALAALRATDAVAYPDDMLWDRRRVGAVALHLTGRTAEAFAVLQDVPDGARIRAEIHWQTRDWASLAAVGGPALPGAGALSEVEQAAVLRHAIALAMLGRETELAVLRARYGASFAKTGGASAFDVLTREVGTIDAGAVAQAMAALPSASPAGRMGDLLDAQATAPRG